jgi:CRP-like cAMP-binding protein
MCYFKSGELMARAGTTLLMEGSNSAHLYTILSGWAFRYKMLTDGRRQILNFALPGDFLGLQSSILDEMQHSVEALTDVLLCVFPREKLWSLYTKHPSLAFDLTWLAAREEMMLDDHLLSVGRRTAIERVAYLLLQLYRRARDVKLVEGDSLKLPLTQLHVADTLGMSLVHTNKTLRRLYERSLIHWRGRTLSILDQESLAELARYEPGASVPRPLI